ncbi:hypothetical protein ScalyP_jg5719 [Parmales sp. scaly parma]|nr:hypothetical protein ScalyP_jg5719 [Parmales sp. scaly parma]
MPNGISLFSIRRLSVELTNSFRRRSIEGIERDNSKTRSSSRRESSREKTASSKKRKNSLFFNFARVSGGRNSGRVADAQKEESKGASDDEDEVFAGELGESKEDEGLAATEHYEQDWMTADDIKNRTLDRQKRHKFVELIEESVEEYDDWELDFIDEKFTFITGEDNFNWERLPDKTSKNPKWKLHKKGDPICYAKCEGVVACTPEHLLGWYWDVKSFQNRRKHIDQNGDDEDNFPNRLEGEFNNHHHIFNTCWKMPFPLAPRSFLHRGIWRRVTRDRYVLCYKFFEEDERIKNELPDLLVSKLEIKKKAVRAEYQGVYLFERMSEDRTRMVYISKVDVKGRVPAMVVNSGLKGLVETVNRAVEYFDEELELTISATLGDYGENNEESKNHK